MKNRFYTPRIQAVKNGNGGLTIYPPNYKRHDPINIDNPPTCTFIEPNEMQDFITFLLKEFNYKMVELETYTKI